MKRIVAAVIAVVFILSLTACGKRSNSSADSSTASSTASKATLDSAPQNVVDFNEEVITIKTNYADLKYPSKWENKVNIETKADKVCFTSADKKVKLFDLCFGGKEGYVFGVLTSDNSTELRVVSYDIDNNLENADELCAMQEDMNVIFQYLIKEGKLTE